MKARLAFIGAWASGAVVVLGHLHFAWLDARGAPDAGHYYRAAIDHVTGTAPLAAVPPGYGMALALYWRALGPSQTLLDLWEGVLLVALVVGAALAGRAVGGARGAFVAAASIALLPVYATSARIHWIHHPEVALASLGLGLAMVLPLRAWAGVAVGLCLGACATVRPSAAVWMAPPLLLWLWRCGREHRVASLAAIASAGLGLLAQSPALIGYFQLRVASRGANELSVGSPWPLFFVWIGPLTALVYAPLAAMGLARGRTDSASRPGLAVGVAWLAVGLLVVGWTLAGVDNVPTVFLGLAVLAAAGAPVLSDAAWRGVGLVLVGLLVLGPGTQFVPALGVAAPLTSWMSDDLPVNWLVPRPDGISGARIVEAATAACPAERPPYRLDDPSPPRHRPPCRVLIDGGMVHPTWEDDGAMAVFIEGYGGLVLQSHTFTVHGQRRAAPWDVAVQVRCEGPLASPDSRFPNARPRFEAAKEGLVQRAVVQGNGCTQTWYGQAR